MSSFVERWAGLIPTTCSTAWGGTTATRRYTTDPETKGNILQWKRKAESGTLSRAGA